jgi:ATP-dependent protease ClpP protease subunit
MYATYAPDRHRYVHPDVTPKGQQAMTVDLTRMQNLCNQIRQKATGTKVHPNSDKWWNIKNAKNSDGPAEVYIYDFIGEWGVTAQDFVGELRDITASQVDLHINSKGGEVWDGLAIYNALVTHPANVTTYVDSLAASAASFIAMAGKRVVMARNARMMIHDASVTMMVYQSVNADQLRDFASEIQAMATLMDDVSNNIADVYAQKAGKDVAYWRDQMRNGPGGDRWYTAQQAVDAGLADEVANNGDESAENAGYQDYRQTLDRAINNSNIVTPNDFDISALEELFQ